MQQTADWSRRRLLAAGLAANGLLVHGAMTRERRVFAQATPSAGSHESGDWSFTDDAGETVTLAAAPQRVVADLNAAAALWDFGVRPVAVSGWTVGTDAAWGNVDRATPNISAGPETGAPDPERYLAANPDLFVTMVWGNEPSPYYWTFMDQATYDRLRPIAPVVGISGSGSADRNAARFAELAGLLGADPEAPGLVAARATYDETVAKFKRVSAERADLSSMFVWTDGAVAYIAYPPRWADLAMYQSFGLNIVTPEGVPEGDYWLEISPEQIGNYPSDLFFISTRTGVLNPEELRANPAFGQQSAVRAGQVYPWNQDFIQSYQGLTTSMTDILTALGTAAKVAP